MIRINLARGPRKRSAAGAGLNLAALKGLAARVKDPLLGAVVVAWVVGGLLLAFLYLTEQRQLSALEARNTELQQEGRRFRTLIEQKERAELLVDSLAAQLREIRTVDANRYVWPHVMEEISKALPDFTWLVGVEYLPTPVDPIDSLAPPPTRFQVEGRTADIQGYTRFVRQLTNSPWIQSVEFGPAQTIVEDERPVTAFTVTVEYRTADSAFIRTVPVLESIR